MAQHENRARIRGLKLDTHHDEQRRSPPSAGAEPRPRQRPSYYGSFPSEDTIRACATPPIEIPGQQDGPGESEGPLPVPSSESYMERYLKDRQTSIQFEDKGNAAAGLRHSIPLDTAMRPTQQHARGRSFAQAFAEHRTARAHSESDRSHYDPQTGKQLPEFSDSPPRTSPMSAKHDFPLLQQTVDAMARQVDMALPMSMTSASTMSPVEEVVVTPNDTPDHRYRSLPMSISPGLVRHLSTSYESPKPTSIRKASERWRDGEAAPDFFARAGSLKKGEREAHRRSSRRETQSSTKSPTRQPPRFCEASPEQCPGRRASPVDAEGSTVGDDYVLGKQIGFGGFSIIREVTQISPQTGKQRTLAVKIVKKQIEGKTKEQNDIAQAEFEHEVDLWRFLNHKHVLALEAVYELKEATFCFVPLNTGGTLFDLISNNRNGLPVDLATNYSYQLASALRYLHLDARVVHRDIKLENCLVDISSGTPGLIRVCDFGLAEWISTDTDTLSQMSTSPSSSPPSTHRERPLNKYFGPSDSSSSAFAGGSLEYAAPEILRIATSPSGRVGPDEIPPETLIVSPAVDIWAMGVCIYALIVGRRPFYDTFQPRVVMTILAGDWNKASLKEKAGQQGYGVVKKCLTVDPRRRPAIGDVFADRWFDQVRSVEGSGDEMEGGQGGWRL